MKQGKRYADKFKEQAVETVLLSSRTQREIAADIGVTTRTLRRWQRRRERLGPKWITKQADEYAQLRAAKREIKRLQRELKLVGAMASFSQRETR